MKSLRRPVVYQGITYPDYEIDFYTSQIHSVRYDRVLKTHLDNGYQKLTFTINSQGQPVHPHKAMAETFYDLLPKSPLVSHYSLPTCGLRDLPRPSGGDKHTLKTPKGFTFICNQVCPDHIDSNRSNNYYSNLMIVTQFENVMKCGPRCRGSRGAKPRKTPTRFGKSSQYKGVRKTPTRSGACEVRITFPSIIDKNGKCFHTCKTFKTEEEAALGYNKKLEEALLTIWGPDLGPKMYDFAYKNVIKTPVQQELIL